MVVWRRRQLAGGAAWTIDLLLWSEFFPRQKPRRMYLCADSLRRDTSAAATALHHPNNEDTSHSIRCNEDPSHSIHLPQIYAPRAFDSRQVPASTAVAAAPQGMWSGRVPDICPSRPPPGKQTEQSAVVSVSANANATASAGERSREFAARAAPAGGRGWMADGDGDEGRSRRAWLCKARRLRPRGRCHGHLHPDRAASHLLLRLVVRQRLPHSTAPVRRGRRRRKLHRSTAAMQGRHGQCIPL